MTEPPTTTPHSRRARQLLQLRLLRRNRMKKPKPASPPTPPNTPSNETLWAAPAELPSDLDTPSTPTHSNTELWAAPAMPPTPSPLSLSTRTSPDSPMTPHYQRNQRFAQLRLLRHNRLRKKDKSTCLLSSADQPQTSAPTPGYPTPTNISFNTSLSPIYMTHTQTPPQPLLTPPTYKPQNPDPTPNTTLNLTYIHDPLNELLNETSSYANQTHMNETQPHTPINLNDTHIPLFCLH